MKIQKFLKNFSQVFIGVLMGFTLFVGVFTAVAIFPDAPGGEVSGGWLGKIFNLESSDETQLSIKSSKVLIPTEIDDVISNKQVPTKEYVDNRVSAAGSSLLVNGSTMPTMLSAISSSNMTWGNAAAYCVNLAEGGFGDWRMPSRDELFYMVSGGVGSPLSETSYLWTKTMADFSITGVENMRSHWIVLSPATGVWEWSNASYGNVNYVRCVR